MNFLFVGTLHEQQIGGAMTHCVAMARAMAEAGHRVAAVAHPEGLIAEALTSMGIAVFPGFFRNAFDARGYAGIRRAAKALRPDVLVSGFGKEYWPLLLSGRLLGAQVALFRHRLDPMSYASERLIPRAADHLIAVSDYARRCYLERGMPAQRLRVLYNPVDTQEFRPDPRQRQAMRARLRIPDDAVVVGFVGRLHGRKGIFELEQALREAMTREPRLHAVWVGAGGDCDALQARIAAQASASRHHLVGWSEQPQAWYHAFSMLVFAPVMAETFGRVSIEAQASGVPAIVSDLGGTPESVRHGVSGLVVAAGDVDALREAILKLCDPAVREPMRRAARAFAVEQFGTQAIAAAFGRFLVC